VRDLDNHANTSPIAGEALIAATLDSLTEQVAVVDQTGTILRVNESWKRNAAANDAQEDLTAGVGVDYLLAVRQAYEAGDHSAGDCLEKLEPVLAGEEPWMELEYPCHGPEVERWFLMRAVALKGARVGAVISHLDITDRWRRDEHIDELRSELAHASRVTTMGLLTASLAHELNQPLTAIVSNAQASHRVLDTDAVDAEQIRDALSDIAADGMRAAEIIQRLRTLLEKRETHRERVAVNAMIREIVPLIRIRVSDSDIDLTLDLAPDLGPIVGDRVQLQQVLLNLLVNACDAMETSEQGNRRLTVRSRPLGSDAGEGSAIEIAVSDTGVGLAPEALDQMFEPFVSSKSDGMGLGLSISRWIVDMHGGRLWATPNPDGGTTLRLALPVAGQPAE
jgi:signal transduction histidine kinase